MDLHAFASLSGTKRERPRGTGEAESDLSLRFPVFGRQRRSGLTFSIVSGRWALSHYACAAKCAQPV